MDMKENAAPGHTMEDDELAGLPVTKRPRVTPRNSTTAPELKPTPHANLRALAGLIRRPSTPARRRASSVGTAFSTGKLPSTTPILHPRTTPRVRRPLHSVGLAGSNPTTPHTTRALQHRRATPGQDRRKSGRAQRETPRDALRNLSRILATASQQTRPSPASTQPESGLVKKQEIDESEDELSPEQPTFTIAVDNNGEDDSSLMDPPRLSMPLADAEETAKSVEVPRRVLVGNEQGRLSRGSFGSLRSSGRFVVPEDSQVDDPYGGPTDDQQWQEVDDELRHSTAARISGENLRRSIHEASVQLDELSSGHLESPPHAAEISPFVLKIPEIKPTNQYSQSPTYGNLPEDDIAQFGTPLPPSDICPSQHLKPVAIQHPAPKPAPKSTPRARTCKAAKVSRYGISYKSLPIGITKSVATLFARSVGKKKARLNKETMNAILEAGNKFFEQLGDDLGDLASHAGRKTIDASDVIAIMQRQRQISLRATAFSLASRYLPGEALKEIRMCPPKLGRQRKKAGLEDIAEGIGEEGA